MQTGRKLWSGAFRVLVSSLVVGILVENVILVRQNGRLRSGEFIDRVSVGQRLMNLAGVTLDGKLQPISLPTSSSRGLVIFTFAPGCPYCRETQPAWAELSNSLREHGISTVWVSRDSVASTKEYCEDTHIPASDVLADPPHLTYVQLGLHAVPTTVWVGADGVVERVWPGNLTPSAVQDIQQHLWLKR